MTNKFPPTCQPGRLRHPGLCRKTGGGSGKHMSRKHGERRISCCAGLNQSRRDCVPQPGVARNELPWGGQGANFNPAGVASFGGAGMASDDATHDSTPAGLRIHSTSPTRGSRHAPTLGFDTKPPWDFHGRIPDCGFIQFRRAAGCLKLRLRDQRPETRDQIEDMTRRQPIRSFKIPETVLQR